MSLEITRADTRTTNYFDTLPDELIVDIIHYATLDLTPHQVLRLKEVCRRFRVAIAHQLTHNHPLRRQVWDKQIAILLPIHKELMAIKERINDARADTLLNKRMHERFDQRVTDFSCERTKRIDALCPEMAPHVRELLQNDLLPAMARSTDERLIHARGDLACLLATLAIHSRGLKKQIAKLTGVSDKGIAQLRKKALCDSTARCELRKRTEGLAQLEAQQRAFQEYDEAGRCERLGATLGQGYHLIDDSAYKSQLLTRFYAFEEPGAQDCAAMCEKRLAVLAHDEELVSTNDYPGLRDRRLAACEAFCAAARDLLGGHILTPQLAEMIACEDAKTLKVNALLYNKLYLRNFSALDLYPFDDPCASMQRGIVRHTRELKRLEEKLPEWEEKVVAVKLGPQKSRRELMSKFPELFCNHNRVARRYRFIVNRIIKHVFMAAASQENPRILSQDIRNLLHANAEKFSNPAWSLEYNLQKALGSLGYSEGQCVGILFAEIRPLYSEAGPASTGNFDKKAALAVLIRQTKLFLQKGMKKETQGVAGWATQLPLLDDSDGKALILVCLIMSLVNLARGRSRARDEDWAVILEMTRLLQLDDPDNAVGTELIKLIEQGDHIRMNNATQTRLCKLLDKDGMLFNADGTENESAMAALNTKITQRLEQCASPKEAKALVTRQLEQFAHADRSGETAALVKELYELIQQSHDLEDSSSE